MVPNKGQGCEKCNNTGYKGRVGLYEVMEVTEDLRELILVGASAIELRRKAVEEGMITLRDSGLRKVKDGVTTIEEVVQGDGRSNGDAAGTAADAGAMEGSDLHIYHQHAAAGARARPSAPASTGPELTPSETKQLAYSVLTDAQKKRFEETLELDFSFGIKGLARFRCNMFNQRGAVGAVYRLIPREHPQLPGARRCRRCWPRWPSVPRGLVLVTGPTGSRQVDHAGGDDRQDQHERHDHILTIEDPIEFVHQHKGCLVNQREVHADTQSFALALRVGAARRPGHRARSAKCATSRPSKSALRSPKPGT